MSSYFSLFIMCMYNIKFISNACRNMKSFSFFFALLLKRKLSSIHFIFFFLHFQRIRRMKSTLMWMNAWMKKLIYEYETLLCFYLLPALMPSLYFYSILSWILKRVIHRLMCLLIVCKYAHKKVQYPKRNVEGTN
jgi:hypothetical protein